MDKTKSLRFNYEFVRVYRRGKYFSGKYCVLHCLPNRLPYNRLGVSTSRKVKGSIQRNRIRRLMREFYRLHEPDFVSGYDIVVLGRHVSEDLNYGIIENDLMPLFERAKLVTEPAPGD